MARELFVEEGGVRVYYVSDQGCTLQYHYRTERGPSFDVRDLPNWPGSTAYQVDFGNGILHEYCDSYEKIADVLREAITLGHIKKSRVAQVSYSSFSDKLQAHMREAKV